MPLEADPLADVRLAISKGATIATLAARSGIERGTIETWLRRGVPSAVTGWAWKPIPTQVAAYRRLVYIARNINSGI